MKAKLHLFLIAAPGAAGRSFRASTRRQIAPASWVIYSGKNKIQHLAVF